MEFKFAGQKWVRAVSGLDKELISKLNTDDRLICCTYDNRYCYTVIKEENLVNLVSNHNLTIREVIHNYPRRVYFDIDIKENLSKYNIFEIIQNIKVYISRDEINVLGYETPEKKSYHITLSNTYFEDDNDRLKFKEYLIFLKKSYPDIFGSYGTKSDELFDSRVYSVEQFFGCPFQSKPGKAFHNYIKGCPIRDIKNCFVNSYIGESREKLFGNVANNETYQLFLSSVSKVSEPNTKKIVNAEKIALPQLPQEDYNDALQLLKMCPTHNYTTGEDLGHGHRWKVAVFCYWNGITFDNFADWMRNKDSLAVQNVQAPKMIDNDSVERRIQKLKTSWNSSIVKTEQYKITVSSFKKYLGNFYPDLATGEDVDTSKFISSFVLDGKSSKFYDNIGFVEKINMITNDMFDESRVVIFNICMGGGKTTATLKYLKDNDFNSFVWLAPRRTLVLNTSERMRTEFDIKHTNHIEVGNNKKKLKDADHLIICNQSLHHLKENPTYDIVVIDEIETVLNTWMDESTHGNNLKYNFEQFCNIIKNASKIILLDAFVTSKTYNFLKSIGCNIAKDSPGVISTFVSDKTPPKKAMIQNSNSNDGYEKLVNKIAGEIREGKKLYIYYAYKSGKENRDGILELDRRIKKIIQNADKDDAKTSEDKLKILEADTDTYVKSLLYFSQSKENNQLGNVNQKWKDVQYIITTPSITVGVNYEGLDYDKIYLLCAGSSASARDIIQTSMRIRKTKEDIIEMFFFDVNRKDLIQYPSLFNSNDIYKNLLIDVYNEYHADFVDSFNKFCSITNYDYSKVPILSNREKVKRMTFINDLYESGNLIEYSKIPDLDESTKEIYESKVFDRNASLIERLAVDKYYFDNKFDMLIKNDRRVLWNFRGTNFIDKMNSNIIKLICNDNNVDDIASVNFQEAKLNDNTVEEIKKLFSMSSELKRSIRVKKAYHLISKLLNNILGINAVKELRDKKDVSRGCEFTDLFKTLNDVRTKYVLYIKEQESKAFNVEFIDDYVPETNIKSDILDNTNDKYNMFKKLKEQNKSIPNELKTYDLDL